jgi:hypothetical protein
MADNGTKALRLKGAALLLMLLAPPLLLYPGAKGNTALEVIGWIVLVAAMIIPLRVK